MLRSGCTADGFGNNRECGDVSDGEWGRNARNGNCDGEAGCGEVTLRRMVEVEVLKNGRVILNVTEVNKTLSDWISVKLNESISC